MTKSKSLRTIKEIRAEISETRTAHHAIIKKLEDELKLAILYKQKTCPHPPDKIKIRSDGYMEEGRMSHPIRWEEKICNRCGKILATRNEETGMGDWKKTK